ncbi:MAG: M4 family metallopeptidase, partial [Anaerolineales bacterium]|nr:M4 family metallopeptidase [Anaerolineales bacterium]
MCAYRRFFQIVSLIVILSVMSAGFSLPTASAQGKDGIKRQHNVQTGKISFIEPESGRVLSASKALGSSTRPTDPGMALAKRFGPEFGLKDPARDLTRLKTNRADNGRLTVRYQQNYQGIPIMGGELIVNTNANGDLYSVNGEISSDVSLSTQPTIDPEQAQQAALQGAAEWYQKTPEDFLASAPALWIYDESLLQPSTRPVELVWRVEVTPKEFGMPVRELVLVNAQRGNISLHFNQIDTIWGGLENNGDRAARKNVTSARLGAIGTGTDTLSSVELQIANEIKTYTGNDSSSIPLPGVFLCDQDDLDCTGGSNPHADSAHEYAIGTYNLYLNAHGRNGIDGNNMPIISTVEYCPPLGSCPYNNAYWSGEQMVYGSLHGYPLADDIVAHELTHGVTQYESNLFYYYQSGAINESFSDLWGEYYDQTNGQGSDDGYEWQIGEDVSGLGAFRNMSNPPEFGHPDKMTSTHYCLDADDSGGVHCNSGVNNKAVYLMVDGDTFNEITVTGIGWERTAAIYYEANTNLLTSGADYSDLYYALQQACSNLIGQHGITEGDCDQVQLAVDAVEMNAQPEPDFNTDIPYCDTGDPVATIFSDDLEDGTGNWVFTNGTYPRWQLDTSWAGPYAHSGNHSLYADDYPAAVTDATARLSSSFLIPSGAYLHFAHAYDFHAGSSNYYDGGVLEYSLDNGTSWVDAGALIDHNGYSGTISTGTGNPLSGRSAFAGVSHGYISTRLNLAPLAGQTVAFRWRMGLNQSGYAMGWWVDDVKIYGCQPVGSGKHDDTHASWTYSGFTATTTTGPYLGTFHYSTAVGNYAEFPFTGSQITVTYSKYSNRGELEVYIDSNPTPVATINQYSATRIWQASWTSGDLEMGPHTVRLVHASGAVVDIDAIEIKEYQAPGVGKYDDVDLNWDYNNFVATTTSGPYLGTMHYSTAVGNYAEFTFTGSQITVTYSKYSNRGEL